MDPITLVLMVIFILTGIGLGILTGLIPGLHVNTVAVIILSAIPVILPVIASLGGMDEALLLLGMAIVALSITHTFLDFIPGAFLGAPDEATAMSVLPAHRYLLDGRGYEAVYLSAIGSFTAVITGMCILPIYWFIFGPPLGLYAILRKNILPIMIGVISVLILSEGSGSRGLKRIGAISRGGLVFFLGGIFGLLVLSIPVQSPFGLPSSVLFPALSGCFGLSTLILSMKMNSTIPPQRLTVPEDIDVRPSVIGAIAGSIMGFLPGMSSAQATVLVSLPSGDGDPKKTILTMSAINTSNSFFVIVALFLISRTRSGAAVVIAHILKTEAWIMLPPRVMIYLLLSAIAAAIVAFKLTVFFGRKAAIIFSRLDYARVVKGIIIFIVASVYAFTGPVGLFILVVSTILGMLPPLMNVRRSHLMGMIMLPVVIYFI